MIPIDPSRVVPGPGSAPPKPFMIDPSKIVPRPSQADPAEARPFTIDPTKIMTRAPTTAPGDTNPAPAEDPAPAPEPKRSVVLPHQLVPRPIEKPMGFLISTAGPFTVMHDKSRDVTTIFNARSKQKAEYSGPSFSSLAVNSHGHVLVCEGGRCGVFNWKATTLGPSFTCGSQESRVVKLLQAPMVGWLVLLDNGELWSAVLEMKWHKKLLATNVVDFDTNKLGIVIQRNDKTLTYYEVNERLRALWTTKKGSVGRVMIDNQFCYIGLKALAIHDIRTFKEVRTYKKVAGLFKSDSVVLCVDNEKALVDGVKYACKKGCHMAYYDQTLYCWASINATPTIVADPAQERLERDRKMTTEVEKWMETEPPKCKLQVRELPKERKSLAASYQTLASQTKAPNIASCLQSAEMGQFHIAIDMTAWDYYVMFSVNPSLATHLTEAQAYHIAELLSKSNLETSKRPYFLRCIKQVENPERKRKLLETCKWLWNNKLIAEAAYRQARMHLECE